MSYVHYFLMTSHWLFLCYIENNNNSWCFSLARFDHIVYPNAGLTLILFLLFFSLAWNRVR